MIRNFKTLGLALVAALALGAVTASSASALFKTEFAPVRVTASATTTQIFTYQEEGVEVRCSTVLGSGEQSILESEDVRFNPTYTGCTVPGVGTAEVSMNGCGYTFTSAKGSTSISTHIVCPEGAKITVTIRSIFGSVCTLHIAPQTPGGFINGFNVGSGTTREISISSSMTKITSTRTGSSLCGPEHSATGTYSGWVTWYGESPFGGSHVGIYMD